jgi:hypothetical protein
MSVPASLCLIGCQCSIVKDSTDGKLANGLKRLVRKLSLKLVWVGIDAVVEAMMFFWGLFHNRLIQQCLAFARSVSHDHVAPFLRDLDSITHCNLGGLVHVQ